MAEKHVCAACQKFALKQITSKKDGKKWWVCQGPTESCNSIYPDDGGKPAFPQENPKASAFLQWLTEDEDRISALTIWERDFVESVMDKAEGDFYSPKQVSTFKKIADKFADSPSF